MLTTNGKVVCVLAVVLLVAGAVLNYPEIVALALGCVLALLIATAWIIVQLDVVAVRQIHPARVAQGETAHARLTVTNRSARRCPPVLAAETVGTQTVSLALPSLASQQSHTAEYTLPTGHRGVYSVGPLTIGQSDPLRLFRVGRSFASQSMLWVHPRVHNVGPVPTGHAQDMEGPTSSSAPQGGVAFHAIREWQWGDDFRLIHWRSTARTGELMVRQMVVPDEPRVLIVLDTSQNPYTDDSFEDAVRVAASLAMAACRNGYPLVVRTTSGGRAAADKHGNGQLGVLDLLAGAERGAGDTGLAELVSMTPDEAGVSLAVVTGQPNGKQLAAVGTVRHRFQMISLAQVGERHGRPAAPPSGVVGVNVATSDDFGPAWNRLVRR